MSNDWICLGPDGDLGPLEFRSDGSYSYGGLTFHQSAEISNTQFGDATVNKSSGEGESLSIKVRGGQSHELRFIEGKWYYKGDAFQPDKKKTKTAGCMVLIAAAALPIGAIVVSILA